MRRALTTIAAVLGLLAVVTASASSLRFFGNGVNDIDRIKIEIDNVADNNPGPPADVGATDFTIEFWLIATMDNSAGAVACGPNNEWITGNVVLDRDRYLQGRAWGLSLGAGRAAFGVLNNGGGMRTICGSTDLRDGSWHHVAVQRRRSDGHLWIWVDGALEVDQDGPDGDISYPDDGVPGNFCGPSGNANCNNSDPFIVIGAEKHDAGSGYPSFSGWVDEIRISTVLRYSAAFTPSTQAFVADADTVGLYHLDEGSGDFIGDSAFNSLSPGERRYGGNPPGPQWATESPFLVGSNAGSVRFASAVYSVGESQAMLTIQVDRISGSDGAVSVDYSTSNGSATAGADYQSSSGVLNWADGDSVAKSFSVNILADSAVEGNETFTVSLSGVAGGASIGSPSSTAVTIQDDDNPPTPGTVRFSAATYSAGESDGSATLMVTRSGGSDGAVSVDYFLDGGTATEGSDFQSLGGTLNWAHGDASQKSISVTILGDNTDENDETVIVSLRSAGGGVTISNPDSATLTIQDDDNPPSPGSFRFSANTYSVVESTPAATFTVMRTGGTDGAVSVVYFLDGGTATAGSDFQSVGGTLNWTDGDGSQKTISVTILEDSIDEGNETVVLSLRDANGGATIGTPGSATLTITDNDNPPPPPPPPPRSSGGGGASNPFVLAGLMAFLLLSGSGRQRILARRRRLE